MKKTTYNNKKISKKKKKMIQNKTFNKNESQFKINQEIILFLIIINKLTLLYKIFHNIILIFKTRKAMLFSLHRNRMTNKIYNHLKT